MDEASVIKTRNLSYRYSKGTPTLLDINLDVEKGSVYGFLGPNGSGKTTTLSLVLGLLNQQAGEIEIFGQPLVSNRMPILKRIGSLIESPSLYGHLTAVENLEVYRAIYGVSKDRVKEVLTMTGLEATGTKVVKKFSLGMKQRLSIALALLPRPDLLVLDEPTNGLDPAGIIDLRQLVKKMNKDYGMTILISSHLLAEVEKMVSHVGIIYNGKMLFQGTLSELHHFKEKGSRLRMKTSDNEAAYQLLLDYSPEIAGDQLSVVYIDHKQVSAIVRMLVLHHLEIYMIQPVEHDLEQLFIHLTTSHS